ncbi:hypothetical protein D9M69_719600 [compost metagenome]
MSPAVQQSDRSDAGAAAASGDAGGAAPADGGGAGAGATGSTGVPPPPLEPPQAVISNGDASTPHEISSVTNDFFFMDFSTR